MAAVAGGGVERRHGRTAHTLVKILARNFYVVREPTAAVAVLSQLLRVLGVEQSGEENFLNPGAVAGQAFGV